MATDTHVKVNKDDHSQCLPEAHDRTLPEGSEQTRHADGLLGCNGCDAALYYCTTYEWYYHVDPDAAPCFLAG